MNLLPNKNLTSTAYFAKNLPVSQIFRLANPNLTKIHNSEKKHYFEQTITSTNHSFRQN